MNQMRTLIGTVFALALLAPLLISAPAPGVVLAPQDAPAADPKAMEAFAEVVKAFRAGPVIDCTSTITISVGEGGQTGPGSVVNAELVSVTPADNAQRRGVLRIRGFTCILDEGMLTATHESSSTSRYFRMPDDGSPYYALLTSFVDLPLPEVALAFGEPDIEETLMQLHPTAPLVQPVAVETITGSDGSPVQRIRFEGPDERMALDVDPATKLPRSLKLDLTGGPFARAGATVTYRHEFTIRKRDEVDATLFAFEPGMRQRVDLLAGLVKEEPAPEPPAPEAGGGGGGGGGVKALVGQPVPALELKTLDGAVIPLRRDAGRALVLDFWATWCGPCRAALPGLHRIAKQVREEELPVDVYTVNVWERSNTDDERFNLVRDFWMKNGHTLPVLLDDGGAARAFRLSAIPTTVIVRSDGVISAVHVGFDEATIAADIRKAIADAEAD